MAVKTEKGSEVKDFTNDPIDNDKILGYNQADGTRWWSLSRFWNWIKSKTASTITAGDKTPVNADAVNGALTNYANVIETEDLNTLVPNADGKPRMWYSPSGSPANRPNESNIWAGIVYNLWGYPVQIAHSLGNVMFTRTGFPYNNSVAWNSWTQVATKSDLANKFKEFNDNSFIMNNRVAEKILTINSTDNNGNGISIDFDIGSKQIRLYEMSSGSAIHTYRADLIIVG